MPRAIFTSDIHIHPYRIGSRDGGMDRLKDGISVLRQSLRLARHRNCPWIFCGDLKMPKTLWPQDALNSTLAAFEEFDDVPKLLMPGNHDGVHGEWGSGLRPFRRLADVIDSPTVMEYHGLQLALWPYGAKRLNEYGAFLELARKSGRKFRCLIAHLMVPGVMVGAMDTHLPAGIAVPQLLSEVFKVAVLGDIHKGQWWRQAGNQRLWSWKAYADQIETEKDGAWLIRAGGSFTGEIFYPGSPYQQSWGEINEWPKGVLEIDFTSGQVIFHPLVSSRFRQLDLRTQSLDAIATEVDRDGLWQGDFVRVFVGKQAAKPAAEDLWARVRERSGARSLHVIPHRDPPPTRMVEIHAGMSERELFETYAKARPLPGFDLETTVKAGLALVKEE